MNALASFGVSVLPIKQGKRVTQIRIGWWTKEGEALRDAFERAAALQDGRPRPDYRHGRARQRPAPSISRLMRAGRLEGPRPGFPENLIVGCQLSAEQGREGRGPNCAGLPEYLMVRPGKLTITACFAPKTSSKSPDPSYLSV